MFFSLWNTLQSSEFYSVTWVIFKSQMPYHHFPVWKVIPCSYSGVMVVWPLSVSHTSSWEYFFIPLALEMMQRFVFKIFFFSWSNIRFTLAFSDGLLPLSNRYLCFLHFFFHVLIAHFSVVLNNITFVQMYHTLFIPPLKNMSVASKF